MKVTIADPLLLRSVRPQDLRVYLQSKAWVERGALSEYGAVWLLRRSNQRPMEALVPNTADIDDYPARISDLLSVLEVVEERPQTAILVDIFNVLADVIRVRAADEGTSDGTIQLDDGVRLVRSARDMVLSAASSAADPKPLYPNRPSEQVRAFIQHSRMGQSETGSYVITVLSRIAPPTNLELIPGLSDPFERVVTRTLAEALQVVQRGANNALSNGDLKPLTESYRQGVSANLCDAIVEMSGPSRHALEIIFSWSPAYPIPADSPERVKLQPEHISIIEEAGKRLRETAPQEDFQLVGVVIGLQRAEGDILGKITVLGFVENKPRRVYLELASEAYEKAAGAHLARIPVSCTGELVKLGRTYVLKDVRTFDVVPQIAEDEE